MVACHVILINIHRIYLIRGIAEILCWKHDLLQVLQIYLGLARAILILSR